MTKGTPSQGLKAKAKLHIKCRRCGGLSYHKKARICSSCGFGRSSRLRRHNWCKKDVSKRRGK